MKKLTRAISLLILSAGFWAIRAGSEWCEKITDADMRNLCTAETRKEAGYCERIKNGDQRHFCQAIAEKNSAYCDKIEVSNLKYYCRAKL